MRRSLPHAPARRARAPTADWRRPPHHTGDHRARTAIKAVNRAMGRTGGRTAAAAAAALLLMLALAAATGASAALPSLATCRRHSKTLLSSPSMPLTFSSTMESSDAQAGGSTRLLGSLVLSMNAAFTPVACSGAGVTTLLSINSAVCKVRVARRWRRSCTRADCRRDD